MEPGRNSLRGNCDKMCSKTRRRRLQFSRSVRTAENSHRLHMVDPDVELDVQTVTVSKFQHYGLVMECVTDTQSILGPTTGYQNTTLANNQRPKKKKVYFCTLTILKIYILFD